MRKNRNTNKRLWLTMEERRKLALKNIELLNNSIGKSDWQRIFEDTVSFSDYNTVIEATASTSEAISEDK